MLQWTPRSPKDIALSSTFAIFPQAPVNTTIYIGNMSCIAEGEKVLLHKKLPTFATQKGQKSSLVLQW